MTSMQYVKYKQKLLELGYIVKEDTILNDDGSTSVNMVVQRPDHSFLSPDEIDNLIIPSIKDRYPEEEELEESDIDYDAILFIRDMMERNKEMKT